MFLPLYFQSDVIEHLRLQHAKDLEKVVYIVFSHQVMFVRCELLSFFSGYILVSDGVFVDNYFCLKGVRNKNKLILRLMEALVYPNPSAYRDQLIRFSALNHTSYSEVNLRI